MSLQHVDYFNLEISTAPKIQEEYLIFALSVLKNLDSGAVYKRAITRNICKEYGPEWGGGNWAGPRDQSPSWP